MQKSTNSGVSWTTIDSVSGSFNCTGMFWLNANEGFAVFSENLGFGNYAGWFKKTANGGASWTTIQQVSATQELNAVWFTSSTTGYVIGGGGVIRKTTNGGTTWSTLVSGTTLDLFTIQFISASTGWIAGDDGVIIKTTNSGASWVSQFQSIFYQFTDIEFTDAQHGVATGTYGLMRTVNGGTSWMAVPIYGSYQFISIDFPSADTGYMGGINGNVWRTVDSGASWLALNRVPNGQFISDIDFLTHNVGFVLSSNVWHTTNAGSGCPSLVMNNSTASGDTFTTCSDRFVLCSTIPSALNPYQYNISPSWVWDTAASYGNDLAFSDSIPGDTITVVLTMTDTFTNCGSITDFIVLIIDSITYQPPPQPTQLLFICPGDSITLDLGANAQDGYLWTTTGDTTRTIVVDTIGFWTGSAFACGGQSNWIYVVQWNNNCTQVCDVDAGPDTTFCQQQGQLNATPASPGNYTFSWSPAYGLDNPNVQNPNVVIGVDSMIYIVTMTDTTNNCIATDTVVVSAYYFHADTTYNCNGSPVTLDFGPGALNYIWQYFTDTSGNTISLSQTGQTITVTQPGQYMGIAIYFGCGALTSIFTVVDSCNVYVPNVWPGDCNYDLTANMADALHIGLAYGATGATRPAATNGWYAQPMTDWSQNYVNCNYKHGDTNGDGVIDVNDTLAISLNYGLNHPYQFEVLNPAPATAPTLELDCTVDTVGLQTLVQINVLLGNSTIPVDSLYGISFRITSESGLIDTNLTAINANTSWLGNQGNDMFTFQKHFQSSAIVDFTEVRNDLINVNNGSGNIATLFIVTTDNLSGIAVCDFTLSDVTAVTVSQEYLQLNLVNDSLVIDPSVPAGLIETEPTAQLNVYPNPASETIIVETSEVVKEIEIFDLTGRRVLGVSPTSNRTVINTIELPQGTYNLKCTNNTGVSSTYQLMIIK